MKLIISLLSLLFLATLVVCVQDELKAISKSNKNKWLDVGNKDITYIVEVKENLSDFKFNFTINVNNEEYCDSFITVRIYTMLTVLVYEEIVRTCHQYTADLKSDISTSYHTLAIIGNNDIPVFNHPFYLNQIMTFSPPTHTTDICGQPFNALKGYFHIYNKHCKSSDKSSFYLPFWQALVLPTETNKMFGGGVQEMDVLFNLVLGKTIEEYLNDMIPDITYTFNIPFKMLGNIGALTMNFNLTDIVKIFLFGGKYQQIDIPINISLTTASGIIDNHIVSNIKIKNLHFAHDFKHIENATNININLFEMIKKNRKTTVKNQKKSELEKNEGQKEIHHGNATGIKPNGLINIPYIGLFIYDDIHTQKPTNKELRERKLWVSTLDKLNHDSIIGGYDFLNQNGHFIGKTSHLEQSNQQEFIPNLFSLVLKIEMEEKGKDLIKKLGRTACKLANICLPMELLDNEILKINLLGLSLLQMRNIGHDDCSNEKNFSWGNTNLPLASFISIPVVDDIREFDAIKGDFPLNLPNCFK